MHGPGGESYYAALWCNDECEYVNPFFLSLDIPQATSLHSTAIVYIPGTKMRVSNLYQVP